MDCAVTVLFYFAGISNNKVKWLVLSESSQYTTRLWLVHFSSASLVNLHTIKMLKAVDNLDVRQTAIENNISVTYCHWDVVILVMWYNVWMQITKIKINKVNFYKIFEEEGSLWVVYRTYKYISQDCDVIRFLSVCCAYDDSIASRYSDDESDQRNITGIDST
jgi:hypothetical protein